MHAALTQSTTLAATAVAATRATTSKTTRRSLVIMNNASGPKRVRDATRRRETRRETRERRARGSIDRSIAGERSIATGDARSARTEA
jgi:ribosomal protein S28E/S33